MGLQSRSISRSGWLLRLGFPVCIFTHEQPRSAPAASKGGLVMVGRKGSHVQLKHPTRPGRTTVPHPQRDFPLGTLKGIGKQSGVKLR